MTRGNTDDTKPATRAVSSDVKSRGRPRRTRDHGVSMALPRHRQRHAAARGRQVPSARPRSFRFSVFGFYFRRATANARFRSPSQSARDRRERVVFFRPQSRRTESSPPRCADAPRTERRPSLHRRARRVNNTNTSKRTKQEELVEYDVESGEDKKTKAVNVTGPEGAHVQGAPRRAAAPAADAAAA